ncbi:hypothetical protein [Pelagerythrobacter sp.]|uniref:hypothetical protein n=1 Tax=Pelagerythrobacter sp. TaxID=2800702 RepID=UPI0035AF8E5E
MRTIALRRAAALIAIAGLAACSPPSDEPEKEAETSSEGEGVSGPGSDAAPALPPEDELLRFTGRWAETVEMCREEPWTITSNRLTAPGDIACDLDRIEKSPGGYAITARCTIEGETQDDNFVLRFAESAQALLVEGATTLPATGLVHCDEG